MSILCLDNLFIYYTVLICDRIYRKFLHQCQMISFYFPIIYESYFAIFLHMFHLKQNWLDILFILIFLISYIYIKITVNKLFLSLTYQNLDRTQTFYLEN